MSGLAGIELVEAAWVRVGGVGLSPWWARWAAGYGERRVEVLRVGRRGGKSTMICRIAVCETIFGDAYVPEGDVGVYALISVDRKEATNRILTIGKMLDAIGISDARSQVGGLAHGVVSRKSYKDAIELDMGDRGLRAIRVFTATIAGVSGFTAIGAAGDEVAKWRDVDTGANPAEEVVSSLRPTMATQPQAVLLLSSSPWGESDAHAKAFAAGSSEYQRVSHAESWVANPTLSEEATRRDEADDVVWAREYAAIPMPDEAIAWFPGSLIDDNTRDAPLVVAPADRHNYLATMDPATRGNAWTLVVSTCTGLDESGAHPRYSVVLAQQWVGSAAAPLRPSTVLGEIATLCKGYGCDEALTDQYQFDALVDLAHEHGLALRQVTSANRSIFERYEWLATQLREHRLDLPPVPLLRADLCGIRRKPTSGGGVTVVLSYTPGDGRHADYAPAVALIATEPPSPPEPREPWVDADLARAKARVESDGDWDENIAERTQQRAGLW